MKFIWNEPKNSDTKWHNFPDGPWEQAILGWLHYNGVWPETNLPYHWSLKYNYAYHFFDIEIFECWLPGHGEPDRAISAMRNYLKSSGLDWEEYPTFHWEENGKQRPGVRFWIQAEDHPRKLLKVNK